MDEMGKQGKAFSVCIGNYGYYAEGELRDRRIALPASRAEFRDFLEKSGLQDPMHEEIYVSDYESVPFGLNSLFGETANIDQLNLLASQLAEADESDIEAMENYLDCGGVEPTSILELMNMLEQADDLPVYRYDYTGMETKDSWGRTGLERLTPQESLGFTFAESNPMLMDVLNSDPCIMSAFDFERYGEMLEDQGLVAGKDFYVDAICNVPQLDAYDLEYFEEAYSIDNEA